MGDDSELFWIRGVAAILNLIAFEQIVSLDTDYEAVVREWETLNLNFEDALKVDTLEEIAFKKVVSAAAASGRDPPGLVTRSELLLNKIPAPYQKLIRDKAAKKHLGAAARTRMFVLTLFKELVAVKAHSTSVCNSGSGKKSAAAVQSSGSATCKGCSVVFTFSGNTSSNIPARCPSCYAEVCKYRATQQCNDFTAGKCNRANCKFMHGEAKSSAALPAAALGGLRAAQAPSGAPAESGEDVMIKCAGVYNDPCELGANTEFAVPAARLQLSRRGVVLFLSVVTSVV